MSNDLISREALKKHAIWTKVNNGVELIDIEVVPLDAIDNTPTVDLVFPTINVNIPEETKQKLIEELQKPHKLLVLPEPEIAFERPQGEWKITDGYPHKVYCNKCFKTYAQANWDIWKDGTLARDFCPNCGADMRGAE